MMYFDSGRVLVIAPHPDDETIGAGGTIARHIAAGDAVALCVVTAKTGPDWPAGSVAVQRRQTAAAAAVLGIDEVRHLGLPVAALDTVPAKSLVALLAALVEELRPEVLYLPSRYDLHRDHRLVFEAGMVAARPLVGCPVRRVLSYEISATARFWPTQPVQTWFVGIDGAPLEAKIAAMRCYETELRDWPHLRSPEGIRALATERGVSVGLAAAECFELIRHLEV